MGRITYFHIVTEKDFETIKSRTHKFVIAIRAMKARCPTPA